MSFNIVVRNRDNWGLIVGSNRDKGMSDVDGVRRVEQVAVDGFGDELAGYSFSPCPFFQDDPYIASDGGDGRRRKANRKGN